MVPTTWQIEVNDLDVFNGKDVIEKCFGDKKSMRKDWRISEYNINVSMASQDQKAFFYMKSRQFCKASRYTQHQHQSNVCS